MNYDRDNCPVLRAASQVGDRWMLLIYKELVLGHLRFDEIQTKLKISKSVLATKLNKMLEQELVEKVLYKEQNERSRYQYQLTRKGKDLFKVFVAMLEWGNKYLKDETESTIAIVDKFQKEPIKLKVLDQDNNPIRWRDTEMLIFANKEKVFS